MLDLLYGFVAALSIGTIAGWLLSSPLRITREELAQLRGRFAPQQVNPEFTTNRPSEAELRRWRTEWARLEASIRAADESEAPRVEAPGGDPSGDIPPLYLYASAHLPLFGLAFTRGLRANALPWTTAPLRDEFNRVGLRMLANQACLSGVEMNETRNGWTVGPVPPEFIDREWTVLNRRNWALRSTL